MISMPPQYKEPIFRFRVSGFFRHLAFVILVLSVACPASESPLTNDAPVKIIFDTDIGNDVDDVLALSVLHALHTRGECELLAVTITRADELAGPFVDAMNTFYGRP